MKIHQKSAVVISSLVFALMLTACSSPEEKAQKYYNKGIALLETDPAKAKLEFQNALQLKRNLTPAIYGLALAAEKQADWQAAFVLLNKVIDQDPNHVDATVKIGQLLLAADQIDKALEHSNRALKLDPKNASAIILFASVQLKLKNNQAAIDNAKLVLKDDPKNTDAYMVLASERLASKDVPQALAMLEKGLAINEKNLSMQLVKIKTLESIDELDKAETSYRKLLSLYPEMPAIRKSLAQFYLAHNKFAEAEKELNEIVKSNPKELQAKTDLVKFLLATKGPKIGREALEAMVKNSPEDYPLSFNLVSLYQSQKETAAADKLITEIMQKAGDNPEGLRAKVMVATQMLRADKKLEGIKLLDEVLAIDNRNEQALLLKAGIAIDEKNFDGAVIDLRTVLRDQPNSSQALFMMAKAHDLNGAYQIADESYSKAFETSKYSSIYGLPFAQSLLKRNQNERAEKVLEEVSKHNTVDANILKSLAQAKIARGDWVSAQAIADRAKELKNSNLADQISGAVLAGKQDYDGSISAFKRAYESSPNDIQPVMAAVRTYLAQGKTKEAQAFINNVLATNPKNFEAKLLQGQVYSLSGEKLNAYAAFEEAILLNPKNPAGYQQLAVANIKASDFDLAEANIGKGLIAVPNNFGLKITLAEIYELKKDYKKAIIAYESVLKDRPDSEIAQNNYVSLISDYQDDEASLKKAYDVAQKLKSSDVPQFLDTLGWISYKMNKHDEAIAALKDAIEKLPKTSVFHYHLGKAYLAKNDKLQAKDNFEKALQYNKNQQANYLADINALVKTL